MRPICYCKDCKKVTFSKEKNTKSQGGNECIPKCQPIRFLCVLLFQCVTSASLYANRYPLPSKKVLYLSSLKCTPLTCVRNPVGCLIQEAKEISGGIRGSHIHTDISRAEYTHLKDNGMFTVTGNTEPQIPSQWQIYIYTHAQTCGGKPCKTSNHMENTQPQMIGYTHKYTHAESEF